jgi:hypothetical protein
MSRGDRRVDVRATAVGDAGPGLLGRGIDDFEPAGSRRGTPFAADEDVIVREHGLLLDTV